MTQLPPPAGSGGTHRARGETIGCMKKPRVLPDAAAPSRADRARRRWVPFFSSQSYHTCTADFYLKINGIAHVGRGCEEFRGPAVPGKSGTIRARRPPEDGRPGAPVPRSHPRRARNPEGKTTTIKSTGCVLGFRPRPPKGAVFPSRPSYPPAGPCEETFQKERRSCRSSAKELLLGLVSRRFTRSGSNETGSIRDSLGGQHEVLSSHACSGGSRRSSSPSPRRAAWTHVQGNDRRFRFRGRPSFGRRLSVRRRSRFADVREERFG